MLGKRKGSSVDTTLFICSSLDSKTNNGNNLNNNENESKDDSGSNSNDKSNDNSDSDYGNSISDNSSNSSLDDSLGSNNSLDDECLDFLNDLDNIFTEDLPLISEPPPKRIKKIRLIDLNDEIKSIDDLIRLGKSYVFNEEERYSIDMDALKKLVKPLQKLNAMIGMKELKATILNQLIYFLAGLSNKEDYLHTVLVGPPGCGKTSVAIILAEIYFALGFVSNTTFKIVKRSDLIAPYLGQTSGKTQKAIDEAMGGVLFIDEAYSLGHKEGRDSYSKIILDTLNQNLSERKGQFICIIAGYEKELEQCFFSGNPGLKRRFPFRYTIDKYSPEELKLIFLKKADDEKWFIEQDSVNTEFFKENIKFFPYSGGDMEILLHMCKMAHAQRIIGKHGIKRRILTKKDIDVGFQLFLNNDEVKRRNTGDLDKPPLGMYT